jgi:hypothetical protein
MKHKASRDLYAYWNTLRGSRPAPERSEVDPGAIRTALGDTIMLSRERGQDASFRLAGTRVCALFCRELKNSSFQPLFDASSRREIDALLDHAGEDIEGLLAGVIARNAQGVSIPLELLLLPLFQRGASDGRMIGVLAPATPPAWLGVHPVQSLTLTTWRHVGPQLDEIAAPRFFDLPPEVPSPATMPAATPSPAAWRGLKVLNGGRT